MEQANYVVVFGKDQIFPWFKTTSPIKSDKKREEGLPTQQMFNKSSPDVAIPWVALPLLCCQSFEVALPTDKQLDINCPEKHVPCITVKQTLLSQGN